MTTTFPTALDSFTNPGITDKTNGSGPGGAPTLHHEQHGNINDAVVALQTKLGTDASTDANSIDSRVRDLYGQAMQLRSRINAWLSAPPPAATTSTSDPLQSYLASQVFGS